MKVEISRHPKSLGELGSCRDRPKINFQIVRQKTFWQKSWAQGLGSIRIGPEERKMGQAQPCQMLGLHLSEDLSCEREVKTIHDKRFYGIASGLG